MSFTEIKQLLSTEVDAYRPKGFAKEIPEILLRTGLGVLTLLAIVLIEPIFLLAPRCDFLLQCYCKHKKGESV